MKTKKIYGVTLILLCAISVSAGSKIFESDDKMKHYYLFRARYEKITIDGDVAIYLSFGNQLSMTIQTITISTAADPELYTTISCNVQHEVAGTAFEVYFAGDIFAATVDPPVYSVQLPNTEDIRTFGRIKIPVTIISGDRLVFSFADFVNGDTISIQVRGYFSGYSTPPITTTFTGAMDEDIIHNYITSVSD